MPAKVSPPAVKQAESIFLGLCFAIALVFHAWGASVGWRSKNLPGVEYRQAQTALSAFFISKDSDFSLAYPTPVLGKPWSIPMEFPLYQWTTVIVSRLTHLSITKSGRAVSLGCFYLTLPALFLLLHRWSVPVGRRWLVLALLVSCPFYVFYSRAFLIETMALMFALWFWVSFERAVDSKRLGWLALAVIAGTGAGLVKVTTFMLYLLPVGVWVLQRFWSSRLSGKWRSDLGWIIAATAIPFTASIWWIWYADRVKSQNPLAGFLRSDNLRNFNFGTLHSRLAPELWVMRWRIISQELTGWPVMLAGVLLLLIAVKRRRRAAWACLAYFGAAIGLFPILYAYHDYYYIANAVLVLTAFGLVCVDLLEQPRYRLLGLAGTTLLIGGQIYHYMDHYYPAQRGISTGGNWMTDAIRDLTRPEEVMVITGQDWNSMTPYYSQRRAMMLREVVENDEHAINPAIACLAGERIGALIITGKPWRENFALVRRLSLIGLAPQPWLSWEGNWIFLPQDRWQETVRYMERHPQTGLAWVPGSRAPGQLGGKWHAVSELSPEQQQLFRSMRPVPVRFFSSYEPQVQQIDNELAYGAHPWTRLIFWLPRGHHFMDVTVWFSPGAYQVPAGQDATDGVGITLLQKLPESHEPRILQQIRLDPVAHAAERAKFPIHLEFDLAQDGEVEFVIDPGPAGRDTRDWLWIRGPLSFD